MTKTFMAAAAEARVRREALLQTLAAMRDRMSPLQLAEDALSLLDPELSLLGRLKQRVQHHRFLSLAILAGAGWLVGAPRGRNGDPLDLRDAGTTPPSRANMKEKKNDSGQDHGNKWPDPGAGRNEARRSQGGAEALLNTHRNRQA